MRLKLIGVIRRSRPRKAPGRHTHNGALLSSSSRLFHYAQSSDTTAAATREAFSEPIQAVLGHSSHEDCKGVIVVLKEESTREITV